MSALVNKLHLVSGPPGSGKTTYCLELFRSSPHNTILILPNKASSEIVIEQLPDTKECTENEHNILTWDVFCQECMNTAPGAWLTPAGKIIRKGVIQQTTSKLAESSYFYSVRAMNGFHERAADFFEELTNEGLSPNDLLDIPELMQDEATVQRLTELADIYLNYRNSLEELRRWTPSECCAKAISAVTIGADNVKSAQRIIFDGFYLLNELQIQMMETLAQHSKEVVATLDWQAKRTDLFARADGIRNMLFNRFAVTETALDNINKRAKSPLIQQLSANIFRNQTPEPCKASNPIVEISAPNAYKEIEIVGREIVRLINSESYRFEDIAIVSRDWNSYAPIVLTVFKKFNIPYRWHYEQPLLNNPLIRTIINMMQFIKSEWKRQDLFERLANPYMNLNINHISRFMNAEPVKNIKNGADEWKAAINAMEPSAITECITKILKYREYFLSALRTNHQFHELIAHMVTDFNWLKPHEEIWSNMADRIAYEKARTALNTYEALQYANKEASVSFARYFDHIHYVWKNTDFPLPSSEKGVHILTAGLGASRSVKAVFILGLLENNFPKRITEDPLLRDEERDIINKALGKRLPKGSDRLEDERMRFYRAITLPSERLYLLYPRAGEESDSIPAFNLSAVRSALPEGAVLNVDSPLSELAAPPELAVNQHDLLLAKLFRHSNLGVGDEETLKLYDLWRHLPKIPDFSSNEIRDSVRWKNQVLSVTAVECYARCPFHHLAKYHLRLNPLTHGIQRNDQGQLIHTALRIMFTDNPFLKEMQLNEMLDAMKQSVEKAMEELNFNTEDWQYEFLQLSTIELLANFVMREYEYMNHWSMKPKWFELGFGAKDPADLTGEPDLPPDRVLDDDSKTDYLPLKLRGNEKAFLCGTIDRVDVSEDGNLAMLIDYKLEGKLACRETQQDVRRIQLPIYAKALQHIFGMPQIIVACDSLTRNSRDRLIPYTIPSEIRAKFNRLPFETSEAHKIMVLKEFDHWWQDAAKIAIDAILKMKKGIVLPAPTRDVCLRCRYNDLCRMTIFNEHDGEPLNNTPFDLSSNTRSTEVNDEKMD